MMDLNSVVLQFTTVIIAVPLGAQLYLFVNICL